MKKLMILGSHIYIQGVGWTVLEKGFCGVRIGDSYRIQKITQNEYWLYDLKDPTFKLKIRRMPVLAEISTCSYLEGVPDRQMEPESVPEG